MGTDKLYKFVDNNPDVMMLTVDYVNDPFVIAQNHKMVAINSCLQVDFNGQVNSESMGPKQFSGIGGQLDYVRGAAGCQMVRQFWPCPPRQSTASFPVSYRYSRRGATVTTTRADVHYIVTEYGIANLRGKSLRERAKLLIGIAHPKFRDGLMAAYEARYGKEEEKENG